MYCVFIMMRKHKCCNPTEYARGELGDHNIMQGWNYHSLFISQRLFLKIPSEFMTHTKQPFPSPRWCESTTSWSWRDSESSYHSPMLCRIKNITLHMWLHKQIHILAMNVNGQSIMYSWLDLNIFIYISLCVCNMYSRVKCIVHQMWAQLTNSIPLLKLFTNLITFFTVIYFLETCKGLSVDGYWSC